MVEDGQQNIGMLIGAISISKVAMIEPYMITYRARVCFGEELPGNIEEQNRPDNLNHPGHTKQGGYLN